MSATDELKSFLETHDVEQLISNRNVPAARTLWQLLLQHLEFVTTTWISKDFSGVLDTTEAPWIAAKVLSEFILKGCDNLRDPKKIIAYVNRIAWLELAKTGTARCEQMMKDRIAIDDVSMTSDDADEAETEVGTSSTPMPMLKSLPAQDIEFLRQLISAGGIRPLSRKIERNATSVMRKYNRIQKAVQALPREEAQELKTWLRDQTEMTRCCA